MKIKNAIRDFLYKTGLFTPVKKVILLYKKPYTKYRTQKLVKPILCKVKNVFDKECKLYWIDYGTLLGYVREGRIIKGDDDLDFGVMVGNNKSLQEALEKEDIILFKRLWVEGKIAFEQYRYKGFRFDIFYYREENGKYITNIWLPHHYNMPQKIAYKEKKYTLSETSFTPFKTQKIKFYDCDFYIPDDEKIYLSEHYGDDYMIPNPNFTLDDEKNRVTVQKEHKVEFYE